ncbi:MAG TPA: M20/M25/M40 family metallo-hydrolase, partial [Desulfosarcina sp.]|nr:M20/M25/M40 family metallo-hydrolase [Desulfosarcina sp.]
MIDVNRLTETFMQLVRIDSVSREEGCLAAHLREVLTSLGAETVIDGSAAHTGSDTGNLVARIGGRRDLPPLLFSAHMDTVEPGRGIQPVLKDGRITSDGTTILGADDKSAIAILLEMLQVLRETGQPHPPLEFVFSTCEEIGLRGAKHLDWSLISARQGYVFDTRDPEGLVIRAPSANRLAFTVIGRDAHAGSAPENGINAILIAARAIAGLQLGRIDGETTCNLGVIHGGEATNIVPKSVRVDGEVRSHDDRKLADVTQRMVAAFESAAASYPGNDDSGLPRVESDIHPDFKRTNIPKSHPVVLMALTAAERLRRPATLQVAGGGSDANVFFQQGIMTGVLGTGMTDVHSVREHVAAGDMVKACEMALEILSVYQEN